MNPDQDDSRIYDHSLVPFPCPNCGANDQWRKDESELHRRIAVCDACGTGYTAEALGAVDWWDPLEGTEDK